jgi:predicted RNA methylase
VKCAKQVYETQDLKEIFSKCISNYEWYLEEDGTKIVHSIKDGINLLENIGDFLVLPEKWFSPTLYKKVGEFLKTFDCKNTSYKKRKAFKNNGKFSNNQILEIGNKLNGVSLSTKFNYYPTPDILVDVVQELAEITDSCTILEPSAGTGSLLKGLNKDNIKCVELNEILAEILKSSKYNCTCSEIENYEPKERFDRIIMNPPFQKRLDAKHILLCFNKFLKENGILVAIHSHGILSNTDKYSKEFQDLCRKYAVYHKSYVSGLFKDSGKGTAIPITVTKFVKK